LTGRRVRLHPPAAEQLLPPVYDELRKLAAQRLVQEAPGQTLQATALAHEAYLRLVGSEQPWNSRGRFQRVEMPDVPAEPDPMADRLIALDDALTRLAAKDALTGNVVELRHVAGLGHEAIAEALGITIYLARQEWTCTRAWVRDAIDGE
jgi:DNA-directed RNA polymerase specialized sigma24 family protein